MGDHGPLDDFRLLLHDLGGREVLVNPLGGQRYRGLRLFPATEKTERGALTPTVIEPVVADKSLGLPHDRHEAVSELLGDLFTILGIEVVVADDGVHGCILCPSGRQVKRLVGRQELQI